MADTWYGYECTAYPSCSTPTGVILDIRLPWDGEPPEVRCPTCGVVMKFTSKWKATESGHGSRGDSSNQASAVVDAWLDVVARACDGVAQHHGAVLIRSIVLSALPPDISSGAFTAELRRRSRAGLAIERAQEHRLFAPRLRAAFEQVGVQFVSYGVERDEGRMYCKVTVMAHSQVRILRVEGYPGALFADEMITKLVDRYHEETLFRGQ